MISFSRGSIWEVVLKRALWLGTNWVSRSSAATNWQWQVRRLNDTLLLVGENGTLRTSSDGVH